MEPNTSTLIAAGPLVGGSVLQRLKRRRLLLRCGVRPCGAGHGDGGSATGSERDDFSIDFMSKGQRAARQPNLPHSAWR